MKDKPLVGDLMPAIEPGHGSRNPAKHPDAARALAKQRADMRRQQKESRREAYEQGVRDALGRIADLESGLVEIGAQLMEKVRLGEALSKRELDTLALAQKTAEAMKDRAMGKATTKHEVKQQQSLLAMIIK